MPFLCNKIPGCKRTGIAENRYASGAIIFASVKKVLPDLFYVLQEPFDLLYQAALFYAQIR